MDDFAVSEVVIMLLWLRLVSFSLTDLIMVMSSVCFLYLLDVEKWIRSCLSLPNSLDGGSLPQSSFSSRPFRMLYSFLFFSLISSPGF
jgi:hypothetical protein